MTDPGHSPAGDLAGAFTFDYRALDDPGEGQRFTRYWDLEPLMRGPEPIPAWLVTDRAAIETDLGVLKTGKEADVHVIERSVPGTDRSTLLAAKRYRAPDHRSFHRNAGYTEGRRTRNSRDARALAKKSEFGRELAAAQWAIAEWDFLKRCHTAGVPVPYPVQIDGTEILMELITDQGEPAPRLAATRSGPQLLAGWFDQLRAAIMAMAGLGFAHGDLSPYNILAAGERLVIIDVPQMIDLAANPRGSEFLHRDCRNVCSWFARRGLEADPEELFALALAAAW